MHCPMFTPLVLAACVAAQTQVTLPTTADSLDANWLGAGFETLQRQQVVLGPSVLTALAGRTIGEVRFRRDGSAATMHAGQARVTVTMSASPTLDPARVTPVFALNHGPTPVVVFAATLSLPSAPPLPHRDAATWTPPDAVVLPLVAPFSYAGGGLCAQFDIEPLAGNVSSWWILDRHRSGVGGSVRTIGVGCGPTALRTTRTAMVDASLARPGSTPRFLGIADAGALAVFAIAPQELVPGLDLGLIGAPGCILHLLPTVTVGAAVIERLRGRPGGANVSLPIPHEPAYLGATLFTQWAFWNGRLTTSNALQLDLALTPATFDGAVIEGMGATTLPATGTVEVGTIPVMRLRE